MKIQTARLVMREWRETDVDRNRGRGSSYRHYLISGPVLSPPNSEWKPALAR